MKIPDVLPNPARTSINHIEYNGLDYIRAYIKNKPQWICRQLIDIDQLRFNTILQRYEFTPSIVAIPIKVKASPKKTQTAKASPIQANWRQRDIIREPQRRMRPPRNLHTQVCGVVYVLAYDNMIKIGFTSNLKARLYALNRQWRMNNTYTVLGIIETTDCIALDRALHSEFMQYNIHSEWFELPDVALQSLLERCKPLTNF